MDRCGPGGGRGHGCWFGDGHERLAVGAAEQRFAGSAFDHGRRKMGRHAGKIAATAQAGEIKRARVQTPAAEQNPDLMPPTS
jgi:hypothetical protein